MPAWSVADIKDELACIGKLLAARPDVFTLEEKLCSALKQKLSLMTSMGPSDLVHCYESISQADVPQTMKSQLASCLDDLAIESAGAKHQLAQGHAQECIHLENFLTQADLEALKEQNCWEGAATLAKRLKMLGVESMKEGVKKTASALLVWFQKDRSGKLLPGNEVYDLAHRLQSLLKDLPMDVPNGALKLLNYPDHPKYLDKDHFAASYPDGPPVQIEFPGFALIRKKHSPVRNTSSLVSTDPWP